MPSQHDAHLALAQRHVCDGERRVADQAARITRLAAAGHDTAVAEALLRTMEETLAAMRCHLLQLLAKEVDQSG